MRLIVMLPTTGATGTATFPVSEATAPTSCVAAKPMPLGPANPKTSGGCATPRGDRDDCASVRADRLGSALGPCGGQLENSFGPVLANSGSNKGCKGESSIDSV